MSLLSKFSPRNANSFNQKFREKRFGFFKSLLDNLEPFNEIKILDIGGTQSHWERMNFIQNPKIHITLINLQKEEERFPNITSLKGDACNLSDFKDKSFDIVYSNSVIEHLFTWDNQVKMANEVRRVGKSYYVQTPNYWFPVEPHWLFPFYQYLPFEVRVFLTKNFNLGHYPKTITREAAIRRVDEVKLLTLSEMKKLFPEGKVYNEDILGLTKSFILYNFPSK